MSQRERYQPLGYSQTQGSNNNANASSNNNNETNADPPAAFPTEPPTRTPPTAPTPRYLSPAPSLSRTQPLPQPTRGAFGQRPAYNTPDNKVYYTCGDCGQKQGFQANDPLRCGKCACRILYKAKTDRFIQFQAI